MSYDEGVFEIFDKVVDERFFHLNMLIIICAIL